MVASNWHDEFILNLDEDNQFYYFSYYPESNYCQEITEVKKKRERRERLFLLIRFL